MRTRGDTGPGGKARAEGAHCTGRPAPTPLLFNHIAAEFVGTLYDSWFESKVNLYLFIFYPISLSIRNILTEQNEVS